MGDKSFTRKFQVGGLRAAPVNRRAVLRIGTLGAAGAVFALTGCSNPITHYEVNFDYLCSGDELEVEWTSKDKPVIVRVVAGRDVIAESPPSKTGPFTTTLEPGIYVVQGIYEGEVKRSLPVTVVDRVIPSEFLVPLAATCREAGSNVVESGEIQETFASGIIVERVHNGGSRKIRVSHDGVNDIPLEGGEATDAFRGTQPGTPWQAGVERLPTENFCTAVPPNDVREVPVSERNPPPSVTLSVRLLCKS